ncbi:DEAD-box RNA helicase [Tieghemostelium lacteum]|uniref:RNA helicase n=1 Tax=Tieghemostelium lacteum TaxID=361077 RepID=A0A151ZS35_TIELA|nr:DEAD-box RNA helicase [Tieghemostelium lacteum]|eukprot:KYQ96745.1 DEAD-box RNA helicase [Tieghemostelium lacteum]
MSEQTHNETTENNENETNETENKEIEDIKNLEIETHKDEEEEEIIQLKSDQLEDLETELVVQSSDLKSQPIYSQGTFEELNLKPELLKGVYAMGFNKPSRIQANALPVIINTKNNLVAQSQSGTGKTGAFTLGMLNCVDPKLNETQVICLSPTHELSTQIYTFVCKIGQFTNIQPLLVIPDAIIPQTIKSQIIIGTPGKVGDFLQTKKINSKHVKMFVLDEADFLVGQRGMKDQVLKIQSYLPKNVRVLLFSATFSVGVDEVINRMVKEPNVRITLKRSELSIDKILQYYINCDTSDNKSIILSELFGYISVGQAIVFVQTRATCSSLTKLMMEEGFPVSQLHGDMTTDERDQSIKRFKEGKTKILISTNVTSRGIDILQVSLVINYDMPIDENGKPDPVLYLHRIGRVGRFGRSGVAITLVHDETSLKQITRISEHLSRPVNELQIDKLKSLSDILKNLKDLTPLKDSPTTTTTTTTTTSNSK